MLCSVLRRLKATVKRVTERHTDIFQSHSVPIDTDTPTALIPHQTGLHYHESEDASSPSYPAPTFIEFASGDLRPPFPSTCPCPVSFDCQWLGGNHDGYPLAATLDEYVQPRQTGSTLGTLEYAALIQSTLTFGFLEAVLRIKIPENFLLVPAADGTTTLSTISLTTLFRDLYHRIRVRHHPDKCRSWMEDVGVTLSNAHRQLWAYRRDPNTDPFLAAGLPQEVSEDILRALCMIGDSLHDVLLQSPSECDPEQTIPPLTFHRLPDRKPAEDQLRAQGWCPLTIANLDIYGFVMLEFVRSFCPFLRHAGEHSRCTETACTVNNTDLTTYIPRHSPDECDCPPTIPSIHLVHLLLSDERIPVVTPSDEGLSVRAADDVPYIAISHVWVDGLGSTTEEGLPACQVSRIASMASSLVPGGAFWIDALCVPDRKDLRKRAIQLMAKTYSAATAVLVIDAGIRCCSKDAPLEETLLRIYTSGWMQRLWTYQEAMLAKKLYFEFADGLVDLEDLMPSHEITATTPLLYSLCSTLRTIHHYMSGGASPKDALTIGPIVRAVRWRTTSRREDETLAIAGLLQIDVRELLNASSPDESMKSLLLQKRKLSPCIIFATAPKIPGIPAFSWAPESFMTGPHPGVWVGEESAICTPRGLLAEYASLVFSEPVELDEKTRYVIRDTTRPNCSFLLQPVGLARDERRESCDAVLIDREISSAIGSIWSCAGVHMVDKEEGTFGEREQVCLYQQIHFDLHVINVQEVSEQQASGTPVMDARWCPTMKFRVV